MTRLRLSLQKAVGFCTKRSDEEHCGVHLEDNSGVDLNATVYGGQNG